MNGLTEALASYAADLRWEDLPRPVVDRLKMHLLDAAGAAIYGGDMPWTRIIRDLLTSWAGAPQATIWNTNTRVPVAHAAFANTVATHAFELDDRRIASYMHPASATLPTALAVAESIGQVTGRELLCAIVAGYEVGLRVGQCVGEGSFRRGFYPPGVGGAFAATVTAARLWGLDATRIAHAISLCANQAAGLYSPTMIKRFNIGRGSYNGVVAVELVRLGYAGTPDALEAEVGGFCAAYADNPELSRLTSGLGQDFEIMKTELKPYVSSRPNHTAIDCVLDLKRQHPVAAAEIERIEIEIGTVNYKYGAGFQVRDVPGALMSVAYCAAVALLDGDAFLDQFTEARVNDRALQDVLARTTVTVNPAFDKLGLEKRDNTVVRWILRDGRILVRERWYAKGHPERRLSDKEVRTKFRRLVENRIDVERAEKVERFFGALEDVPDASTGANVLLATDARVSEPVG
jgi:2-methylcitrate dehydratase PrpD